MKKSIGTPEQLHFQKLLRVIRQESDLTQVNVANWLCKPQSFICKYESSERRLDLPELREVCLSLGIALIELAKRFETGIKQK